MIKPIGPRTGYGKAVRLLLALMLFIPLIIMFESAGGGKNYICGDTNGDGRINNNDLVYLINHLFRGGPAPDPPEAGDVNCDGGLNVPDVVYFVEATFARGPELCANCP